MNKGTMEGIRPLEQWIEKMMAHYEAAGLAVAVVDKNVTLYQKFFGFRDAENQTPIDENTIFGLASVSKSFTALSIMQLAEKGVIDLGGPVSRYLPEFQNAHAAQPVTVAHLLSHAGGFLPKRRMLVEEVARDLGIWQDGKAEIGPHPGLAMEGCRRVCKGLDEEEARTGLPGEYMSYSNDSYGLLSEIIRRYGGENSFQDYLERMCSPLWGWIGPPACLSPRPRTPTAPSSISTKTASVSGAGITMTMPLCSWAAALSRPAWAA